MISSCSDEDLIDIVLPRIAKVFTLWDFLLLKVQKGVPRRPQADNIYREFQTLAKEVKEVCSTFMQPATEKSTNTLKVGHWLLTVFYLIVFLFTKLENLVSYKCVWYECCSVSSLVCELTSAFLYPTQRVAEGIMFLTRTSVSQSVSPVFLVSATPLKPLNRIS